MHFMTCPLRRWQKETGLFLQGLVLPNGSRHGFRNFYFQKNLLDIVIINYYERGDATDTTYLEYILTMLLQFFLSRISHTLVSRDNIFWTTGLLGGR